MNILWVIVSFVAGVAIGILVIYFTKVRSLRERIEKMKWQHRIDTIYTDLD